MNIKTLITATATGIVMAANAFAGDVTVSDVWARASAGNASAGAAFMTIHNPNTHDHALVEASADVAARVELHTHIMSDGVMQMRQVEGGINVPAGETVMLQPGGYHVMLMGLHAPLKEGSSFPLTLTFTGGRTVTVDVAVMAAGAMGAGGMHHGDMKHGDMKHGDMGHSHGDQGHSHGQGMQMGH